MKSKSEILKITNPVFLFSDNLQDATSEYKLLAKKYHPDLNKDPDSHKIFVHIKLLFEQAVEMFNKDLWEIPGIFFIKDKSSGTSYKIKYRVTYKFELGDMYIGDSVICYLIDNKYEKYFNNLVKKIDNIKYQDNKIKLEFEKLTPDLYKSFYTIDNRIGIIIKKTKDLLLLKDFSGYYNNQVDSKHIAWILNCLYNLSCFFSSNLLSHNNISLDTCFISPKNHSVVVLGGWFYATYFKDNLIGVTKDIFNIMPPDIKRSKKGNATIDLESIKLIGRTLLGDSSGMKLNKIHSNIDPMINWLRLPSKQNSVQDYIIFDKVLKETFGDRKFIKIDLDAEKLYK